MTEPTNTVLDKLERGETPTKAELEAAGLCLLCMGFGSIYVPGGPGDDEGEVEIKCKVCGGTGEAKP